jgi:[ribosomal protein S18]-alanine N-acetyltransferase
VRAVSSDEIEIAEMEDEDLPGVLAIERISFVAPWSRRLFEETLLFPFSVNFVLKREKKVIGYISLYVIGDEAQVLNVAIHPKWRRQGYASMLFSHVMEYLKPRKVSQYLLEVREGNREAINLYRKYGFEVIGKRRKYYTETNEDALVMQLCAEC